MIPPDANAGFVAAMEDVLTDYNSCQPMARKLKSPRISGRFDEFSVV